MVRAENPPIGAEVNLSDLGLCVVTSQEDDIICFQLLEGEDAGKFTAFRHDDVGPFQLGHLN